MRAPTVRAERLEGFEGLRAVAALGVFLFHLLHMTYAPKSHWVVREISGDLNAGVVVFFVISGFLLYLPFARAQAGEGRPVGVRGFLVRRLLRIYPGYWVALALSLWLLVPEARFERFGQGVQHTLLVHSYWSERSFLGVLGVGQSWTLVIELAFYLFLPVYAAVVLLLARRSRLRWPAETGLLALAAVGLASQAYVRWGQAPPWVDVLPAHLFYFAIGMGLALARVRVEQGASWAARWERAASNLTAWWALALVAFVGGALLPGPLSLPIRPWSTFAIHVTQGVLAFAVVVPFTVVHATPHPFRRLLSGRLMVFLGVVSYGIYLWHPAVMRYVTRSFGVEAEGTLLVLGALALPATILVAWASYRAVEAPAIAWSQRLGGRWVAPRSSGGMRRPGRNSARR